MYRYGLWRCIKYEIFEWGGFFGNPGLGMAPSLPRPPVILLPDGLAEFLKPEVSATFVVRNANGSENYVASIGKLHHRYDGGD